MTSMWPVLTGGLLPLIPGFLFLRWVAEFSSGRKVPLVDLFSASAVIGAAACLAAVAFERLPGWLRRRSSKSG